MKTEKDYYIVKLRGRITEDQLIKHVVELKEKRSITPDTHKSRTIVKDAGELVNFHSINELKIIEKQVLGEELMILQQEELDHQFYVDEYQYKDSHTSHVLHFGINTFNKPLKEEIEKYNKSVKGKLESVKSISYNKIQSYKESINQIITKIEHQLIDVAIDSLSKLGCKTILVDIFDRDVNKTIKFEDDNSPKTHTIVLYEQNSKYLVIDPSNANFSQFLIGANENIKICFTGKKELKIYDQKARDCVDIAVKLAFNLNYNKDLIQLQILEEEKEGKIIEVIDLEKLKNSMSIKDITNQQETYKLLPPIIGDLSFKVKQSSNIFHSKKITETLVQIGAKLSDIRDKLIKRGHDDIYVKVNDEYELLLSKEVKPEKYVSLINCIIGYYQNEICDIFKEQDLFLTGELYKIDQQELTDY